MGGGVTVPKQWAIGLVAVIALVAGGIATALLLTAGGTTSAVRTSELAVKLGSGQQARLERGMTAPHITAEAAVLAIEIRAQFLDKGQLLLPAGSWVRIDRATFEASSSATATVDASVTGPQSGHWQLLLVREHGNWLLIGTRKLP
jgi:hypothetical protein